MGTRGYFPGVPSGRSVKLTTEIHPVPRKGLLELYIQYTFMAWCSVLKESTGRNLFYFDISELSLVL